MINIMHEPPNSSVAAATVTRRLPFTPKAASPSSGYPCAQLPFFSVQCGCNQTEQYRFVGSDFADETDSMEQHLHRL